MAADRVSEFLAREKDDLGDLAGEIQGGNAGSGKISLRYFIVFV